MVELKLSRHEICWNIYKELSECEELRFIPFFSANGV